MRKKIFYVFKVEHKSCAGDTWVDRSTTMWRFENNTQKTPYHCAGEVAARQMDVTERGVRVTFLGLQGEHQSEPITPLSPFTLTLERDDSWSAFTTERTES